MNTTQSAAGNIGLTQESITISAQRDWTLAGTLFSAREPLPKNAPVILVSGAAAVPQGFYAAFAKHLIDQGAAAVLTYDYRGMGASCGDKSRWSELRMKHWALWDMPAAMQFLTERFPKHPLCGLGHSYGGQALGLLERPQQFSRYATVATISGHWRLLDEPYGVWFKTQIIGKAVVKIFGSVPKWAKLGEEMPGTIFLDWAGWVKDKSYFFDDPDLPETHRYTNVSLPLLSIGIKDDAWGTEMAVDGIMKHYTHADLHQHWVNPSKSGKIGHLGYFRKRHKDDHWHVVTDFLLKNRLPEQDES